MSGLSLKQIEDKLNKEFSNENRQIIFWYDEDKEFKEDIEELNLKNAKIYYLKPNNLFKTKVLLERKDKESNYLIYAPFKKPANRENHLADIILYSKEFFADRVSLLTVDLGIDPIYKSVIDRHIKFFNSKERTNRFYDIEVDVYNEETIEIALLSAITRLKLANFEEVVRIVLTEDLYDNKYMEEFTKYNLDDIFWKYCNLVFSYHDEDPSLIKLVISLFLTYTKNKMNKDLPNYLNKYLLSKPGTTMAFIDSMMNSILYIESFRKISDEVYKSIEGKQLFSNYEIEDYIDVDLFKGIDIYIIHWILEKLMDENLNVKIKELTLPEICKSRKFKHFKDFYKDIYDVLINAYYLILYKNLQIEDNIIDLVLEYDKKYYKIDTYYRKFYYHLDKLQDKSLFENLEMLVENIYINKYLDVISKKFSSNINYEILKTKYNLQKDFYSNFIMNRTERIIVIISDAFRYEIAKELVDRFKYNEKVEAEIEPQIGVIPTYTSLGMAALLPHKRLEIEDDYSVYIDGKSTRSLVDRRDILRDKNPKSDCIQYDDLVKMKKEEMRDFFIGKQVIYIYHNQIDARGDKLNTEDEVFIASDEAINEIEDIIRALTNSISATRFIVTADHGFIYTRSMNRESDKIERFFSKSDKINKRFIISEKGYESLGTTNIPISNVLENEDSRVVTVPITSNIYKTSGGGQNFFHGGSSPQEVIVPVINVKTIRGAIEVEDVKISLISNISKIMSTPISLDFVQQEAVSDTIKPATYRIKFVDESEDLISNEEIYVAKSKAKNSSERIFNLKFNLKNQKYCLSKKYYFTISNMETDMEIYRQQVIIDIAFEDNF